MKKFYLSAFFGFALLLAALFLPQLAMAGMPACEDECTKCATICEKTEAYCKKQGGAHNDAAHLKRLEDCAKMCRSSADFMKRDSEISSKVCALCHDACTKCAESCDALKDPKMKECADECRKCADSCKTMSKG